MDPCKDKPEPADDDAGDVVIRGGGGEEEEIGGGEERNEEAEVSGDGQEEEPADPIDDWQELVQPPVDPHLDIAVSIINCGIVRLPSCDLMAPIM